MASNSITVLSFLLFLIMFTYSEARELGHAKKTKLSFYFQDYVGGPNPTVLEIIGQPGRPSNFSKFGAMFSFDDPITEGFKETSTIVARGQGVYTISALDGTRSTLLMFIVFTNGKYKDSTLQLQGNILQFEKAWEVAVVSGTGKFRFARGYATLEVLHFDPARIYTVMRFNITVLH